MKIIEVIGVLTGIWAVYLLYKNQILTWPIGFISIFCFLFLFWKSKLYGDFVVQIMFLLTGIWGWYNWNNSVIKTPSVLSKRNLILWILFTLVTIPINVYLLETYFIDCSYPIAEAAILSLSLVGQILTTQHKVENWYWWIIADILMVIVYVKKDIYLTSFYAAILLFIGIFGLMRWKKLAELTKK
jgi:nicotinamide mononucleotide transporter